MYKFKTLINGTTRTGGKKMTAEQLVMARTAVEQLHTEQVVFEELLHTDPERAITMRLVIERALAGGAAILPTWVYKRAISNKPAVIGRLSKLCKVNNTTTTISKYYSELFRKVQTDLRAEKKLPSGRGGRPRISWTKLKNIDPAGMPITILVMKDKYGDHIVCPVPDKHLIELLRQSYGESSSLWAGSDVYTDYIRKFCDGWNVRGDFITLGDSFVKVDDVLIRQLQNPQVNEKEVKREIRNEQIKQRGVDIDKLHKRPNPASTKSRGQGPMECIHRAECVLNETVVKTNWHLFCGIDNSVMLRFAAAMLAGSYRGAHPLWVKAWMDKPLEAPVVELVGDTSMMEIRNKWLGKYIVSYLAGVLEYYEYDLRGAYDNTYTEDSAPSDERNLAMKHINVVSKLISHLRSHPDSLYRQLFSMGIQTMPVRVSMGKDMRPYIARTPELMHWIGKLIGVSLKSDVGTVAEGIDLYCPHPLEY